MSTKPAASNNTQAKPQTDAKAGDNGAAKDDAENAIVEAAKKLSMDQRKALAARVLEGDASEDDLKMFEVLKTENMKATAARKVHIDSIKAAVEALAGTPRPFGADDMQKIFSSALISEVAHSMGLVKTTQGAKAKTKASGSSQSGSVQRNSDSSEILLKGTRFEYKKGRIYEDQLTGKEAADKAKAADKAWLKLPTNLINNATSEKKLLDIATEAGKTYFATAEGKAELQAILAYSQSHADYVATHGGADKKAA